MMKRLSVLVVLFLVTSVALAQQYDSSGNLKTASLERVQPTMFHTNVLSTSEALVQILAAPGAGLSYYITDIHIYSSIISAAGAETHATLKHGTGTDCATGTTTFYRCMNPSTFSGCAGNGSLKTPIKIPANEAVCFRYSGAGTRIWDLSGYTAP